MAGINLSEKTVTVYLCRGCSKMEADAPPPLRECSKDDCNEKFVSEERNCTQCNRPFTRKLAEHGCEDCLEEEGMEEVEVYGTCGNCQAVLEPGGEADIEDSAESEAGVELVHVTCCTEWVAWDSVEQP